MADSIDRVFAQALATIRALSNPKVIPTAPIQRPPIENRIHLYGLYKQATEGDVDVLMARPTGTSEEDESGRNKWDAWYSQRGLRKTEAKRRYIPYLLDTMRKYASSTPESRELIAELQGLWDQVKDVPDSEPGSPPPPGMIVQNQHRYGLATSAAPIEDDDDDQDAAEAALGSPWQRDIVAALDSLSQQIIQLRKLVTGARAARAGYFVTAPSTPSQLSRRPSPRRLGKSRHQQSWRGILYWVITNFWRFAKRAAVDISLVAAVIVLLKWRRNMRNANAS